MIFISVSSICTRSYYHLIIHFIFTLLLIRIKILLHGCSHKLFSFFLWISEVSTIWGNVSEFVEKQLTMHKVGFTLQFQHSNSRAISSADLQTSSGNNAVDSEPFCFVVFPLWFCLLIHVELMASWILSLDNTFVNLF